MRDVHNFKLHWNDGDDEQQQQSNEIRIRTSRKEITKNVYVVELIYDLLEKPLVVSGTLESRVPERGRERRKMNKMKIRILYLSMKKKKKKKQEKFSYRKNYWYLRKNQSFMVVHVYLYTWVVFHISSCCCCYASREIFVLKRISRTTC